MSVICLFVDQHNVLQRISENTYNSEANMNISKKKKSFLSQHWNLDDCLDYRTYITSNTVTTNI